MNKTNRFLVLFVVLTLTAVFVAGCASNESPDATKNAAASGTQVKVGVEDDKKIKELITNYFDKLYSDTIENYKDATVSGKIHNNIASFISQKTTQDAQNNPEISIHYPRYVEVNGLDMISYQPVKNDNKLEIVVQNIGSSEGVLSYFVKLSLKAKCVPGSDFDVSFVRNTATGYYDASAIALSQANSDTIKVQAKYDVRLIKELSGYKILTASEAGAKPTSKSRIFKMNNDFIVRIPYISVSQDKNSEIPPVKADLDLFEREKKVITSVINKLKEIDANRMKLMGNEWNTSLNEFSGFLSVVGVRTDTEVSLGDADSYKKNFPLDAFPLRINMEKITKIENITPLVHPGYSENRHIYVVKFDASVEGKSGIIGDVEKYKYDYTITLKDNLITSIKLNEVFKVK